MRMSFTLDCNHRDVFSNGGMALHYTNVQMLANMHGQAGPYISMRANLLGEKLV